MNKRISFLCPFDCYFSKKITFYRKYFKFESCNLELPVVQLSGQFAKKSLKNVLTVSFVNFKEMTEGLSVNYFEVFLV